MSLVTKPYTFTAPNTIIASEHNSNFDTIYSDYNGNITTANISASAAIPYSKLSLTTSIRITDIAATLSPFLVPSGGIIMWSGLIANIPTGWYLCDGSNSTPDLRNRFIVCADADSGGAAKTTLMGSATQSGGSTTIDITQIPAHTHSINVYPDPIGGAGGSDLRRGETTGATGSAGGGLPYAQPYYALAYIMKS